jgi:4-carboxymuconolactone decarboxylase
MSWNGELAPVADAAWPQAIGHMREEFAGQLNVYRVMAHHPDLLAAWAPLREQLVRRSTLPPRLQELVVLRTAFRACAPYERAHHMRRGRAVGLSDQQLTAALQPSVSPTLGIDDALVLRAVDELSHRHALSRELRTALSGRFSPEQVLDLMGLVGFYFVLSYIVNSFDVPLEPGIAR